MCCGSCETLAKRQRPGHDSSSDLQLFLHNSIRTLNGTVLNLQMHVHVFTVGSPVLSSSLTKLKQENLYEINKTAVVGSYTVERACCFCLCFLWALAASSSALWDGDSGRKLLSMISSPACCALASLDSDIGRRGRPSSPRMLLSLEGESSGRASLEAG